MLSVSTFKNSIATQLLKTVFGVYFIVTLTVTVVQMVGEFSYQKDHINEEIKGLEEIFGLGIATSLWEMNGEQLDSILQGILKVKSVIGIKIEDSGETLGQLGFVQDAEGKVLLINENHEELDIVDSPLGMFSYRFNAVFTDQGKSSNVGVVEIYSDSNVVIDKVKYSYIMLIINSFVKTIALWIIFLYFARKIVGNPLQTLTEATKRIDPNNPKFDQSHTLKKLYQDKKQNEISIMAKTFVNMKDSVLRKIHNLNQIKQVGAKLSSTKEIQQVYEIVAQSFKNELDFQSIFAISLNNKNEFEIGFTQAIPDEMLLKFEDKEAMNNMVQTVTSQNKLFYLPDISKADWLGDEKQNFSSFNQLLGLPLIHENQCIGVILCFDQDSPFQLDYESQEFLESLSYLLTIGISDIRHLAVIQEQNRTLEQKVELRTTELKKKNNDIGAILENINQGVFTILPGNKIHHEYSKHLENIVPNVKIADANVIDFLFSNSNISSDHISQMTTGLSCVLGEDQMMYDLNSHVFSKEIEKDYPDGHQEILELDWSPIVNEENIIEKILVTVREVSEIRKMEADVQSQKRELAIVGEILAVTQENFSKFIESSNHMLEENRKLIQQTETKDKETLMILFRNMHTVKGNARTYNLQHLTHTVHTVEQTYVELGKDEKIPWNQEQLLTELEMVQESVNEYDQINQNKLGRKGPGRRGDAEEYALIPRKDISEKLDVLDSFKKSNLDSTQRKNITDFQNFLRLVGTSQIERILSQVIESLPSLAQEMGKEPPTISIHDSGIYFKNQKESVLNSIFMHLFRNSIDHGIETPEIRASQGKPTHAKILLDLILKHGKIFIRYRDDGRGLNLEKIKQKAIDQHLFKEDDPITDEKLASLIFKSSFSTADQVTEISGRGVGMDAVKKFIEKEKGTIEIQFLEKGNQGAFRPFEFLMTFPENHIVTVVNC